MPVVPPQGLILVTGANGCIASVTIKRLLDRGYRVRGTVRSATQQSWMPGYFGPNFSLAEVPDFSHEGAFDEAIKGVDGVLHIAADVSFTTDPIIIEQAVKGMTNILEASSKEPSVKRVTYTSAKAACIDDSPGVKYQIGPESWNDAALEQLKQPKESLNPAKYPMLLYAASKVRAERTGFDFVREKKPSFVFNSVVPNVNIGRAVAVEHLGFRGSASLINLLDKGLPLGPVFLDHQWYVNIDDTVLLHLATLTLDDVQNERLLSLAGPFSWNQIIEILRRRFPERKTIAELVEEKPHDIGKVDNSRAEEVLRRMGRDGFKDIESSLVEAMEVIVAADSLANVPKTGADHMAEMMFKPKVEA